VTGRDRMVLMVAVVLVVAGGFWMLVLGPRRHESADLAQKVSDQRAQVAQITQQLAATPTASRAQGQDAAQLAALGQAVPADDETASLIYQLQDAAGRAHVVFNSIEPSGANGAPAGNAAAAAPTTTTPASGTSTTPAPAADASATPAAPGATPGPAGVQQMALSLVFDGRYADLERFLRRVYGFTTVHGQTIRVSGRLLSVDGVELAAAPTGFPDVRATITATAYIAPTTSTAATSPGAAGSAAPATAAASAPAASSTTPPVTPAMVGGAG
jgi:hypothetical protein